MMIAMRGAGEMMGGATEDLVALRSDTVTVNATVIHIVDVTAR